MLRRIAGLTGTFLMLTIQGSAGSRLLEGVTNESTMTYRLIHPLHEIEATSKEVEYRIEIDSTTQSIATVSAHVDVTSFNSGNSSRDSHAMEVIDALTYPEASFSSTTIETLADSLMVSGRLTFHGVTKDAVVRAKATWLEHRLQVEGTFDISLTEFSIERPSLLLIPVEDTLRFAFTAAFPRE